MSYYDRVTNDFGNLGLQDRRDHPGYSGQRDYPPQPYGAAPPSRMYDSYSSPPPSGPRPGYDNNYDSNYGAPPPVPSRPDFGSRDASYNQPPTGPEYRPPQDKPPLPEGWIPLWDVNNQHWYYAEKATGRTQWEAPGFENRGYDANAPPPRGHADDHRGYGGSPAPGGYGGGGYGGGAYYDQQAPPPLEQKKSNKSGMLMGAAGGLAVGAIGGALLANAFDDDDDDEHHHSAPPAAAPAAAPVYADQGYGGQPAYESAPPDTIPVYNAYGEKIDDSDRESLQEAREEYEEAQADAASSSASSSDLEELAEAREEYQEEYEEAYYDE